MKPRLIRPTTSATVQACGEKLRAILDDPEGFAREPLLFRGFDLRAPSHLTVVMALAGTASRSYIGGNSPRTRLEADVYTSTEHSPIAQISLHQELSYESEVPDICAFLCGEPSLTGGATPLCDAEKVLDRLDSRIVEAFIANGLRYIQRLPREGGLGKTWMATFETIDKEVCEATLASLDVEYWWEPGETLVIVRNREALRRHSRTGRLLWFNQADQWHPCSVGSARAQAALELVYGGRLPHDVTFGDGSAIPDDFIGEITRTTRTAAWAEPWQAGDLLVLDNQSVMHGRDSYTGPRSVYVAMADFS